MSGDSYSQRTPAVTVNDGTHSPVVGDIRVVREAAQIFVGVAVGDRLVRGTPSRKSAKSDPVSAPVNAKPPRGSCCDEDVDLVPLHVAADREVVPAAAHERVAAHGVRLVARESRQSVRSGRRCRSKS